MLLFYYYNTLFQIGKIFVIIISMKNKKDEMLENLLLGTILNNIPFALWVKDIDNKYIIVNREYENFYGIERDEIIDKEILQPLEAGCLTDSESYKLLKKTDEDAFKRQTVSRVEVWMNIRGKRKCVEITKAPIADKDGNLRGILGISHDVTSQKKYEKLLMVSRESAEKANATKSEFLANISHEIRTPMNGILGFLQLLLDTDLNYEQRDFASEAKKSSEILLNLLNDILDLSKVEAGKMDMEEIGFNVRYVVEDVATLASSDASKKGLEINTLCYSNVPEKVIGDPGRLKQVLNNFVNNAIKFTEKGEINVFVKLADEEENKVRLLFEIQDTGIGIKKENQGKVFEAFTQADSSTTRKYGGTGLGLAICKRIITMMNGQVFLTSKPDVGSTFSFSAEFKIDRAAEKLVKDRKTIEGKRVLIVDDNETNIKVVEHYLGQYGVTTVSAPNVSAAVSILEKGKDNFDIILTDYCMPDINGIEFAGIVKKIQKFKKIPIVLLTSRAQIGDYKVAKENALSGYLPKPVRKNDLIECMEIIFGNDLKKKKAQIVTKHTVKELRHEERIKILIAEDDELNQKLMMKMLNKMNLNCDIAFNGYEAIESYKVNGYDLIFMDCQMPVMNGYEATQAIRKIEKKTGKNIPIVALTANSMPSDMEKCFEAGMSDFLSKPVSYELLFEKIRKLSPSSKGGSLKRKTEPREGGSKAEGLEHIIVLVEKDLGVSKEEARLLIREYLSSLEEVFKEIEEKLKERDFEALQKIAHTIKGASGNLRLNSIYTLAIEMQDAAKVFSTLDIKNILSEMKEEKAKLEN